MSDKEKLAQWMIQRDYATGHGDTIEDLLVALDIEIVDRWTRAVVNAVHGEREACAKVCEAEGERIDASWVSCAFAIRERGAP